MKKTMVATLSSVMLLSGLAACTNNNDNALNRNNNDNALNRNNDVTDNRNTSFGPNTNDRTVRDVRDDRLMRRNDTTNIGYYKDYDGRLAEQVAKRIEQINGVKNASVILYEDTALVGIDTTRNDVNNVEREARNICQTMTNKDEVRVVSDSKLNGRIRDVDTRLRRGSAMDEVTSDIRAIMNDLGNAAARPFENNR